MTLVVQSILDHGTASVKSSPESECLDKQQLSRRFRDLNVNQQLQPCACKLCPRISDPLRLPDLQFFPQGHPRNTTSIPHSSATGAQGAGGSRWQGSVWPIEGREAQKGLPVFLPSSELAARPDAVIEWTA
jgi:hypothetical protein